MYNVLNKSIDIIGISSAFISSIDINNMIIIYRGCNRTVLT